MSKVSRWKSAEGQGAKIANEFLIPAERISRASNYSESIWDISLKDLPEYKVDSKYSVQGWKTNRMLDVVAEKYCKDRQDKAVLLTKGYREVGMKAMVDARLFFMLLSFFHGYASKEELEKIYYNE